MFLSICIFLILFPPLVILVCIRNNRTTPLKTWLTEMFVVFLIAFSLSGVVYLDACLKEEKFNDGQCDCGGEYVLFDIEKYHNDATYYYTCDSCGKLIDI